MTYRFLEKLIDATKDYIIEKLPAYKKAQWDILETPKRLKA